jgi:hypothetical protein
MTVYTNKPTTVSLAKAAIRSGFSHHTRVMAAGFLIQPKPGSTLVCCSCYAWEINLEAEKDILLGISPGSLSHKLNLSQP